MNVLLLRLLKLALLMVLLLPILARAASADFCTRTVRFEIAGRDPGNYAVNCTNEIIIVTVLGLDDLGLTTYKWKKNGVDAVFNEPLRLFESTPTRVVLDFEGQGADGCTYVGYLEMDISPCSECNSCAAAIIFPIAFSPDGNGVNDVFRAYPYLGCQFDNFKIEIENRWGQTVYESDDILGFWDGRHNGRPAPSDGFIFYATVRTRNGETCTYHSTFTLVR